MTSGISGTRAAVYGVEKVADKEGAPESGRPFFEEMEFYESV